MPGLDGLQGPCYVGTGCCFRRQSLYGKEPPVKSRKSKCALCCSCFCCCRGDRGKGHKGEEDAELEMPVLGDEGEGMRQEGGREERVGVGASEGGVSTLGK